MKMTIHPDMIEATRLTCAGQLTEATALLQSMLIQGGAQPGSAAGGSQAPAESSAHDEGGVMKITAESQDAPGLRERGSEAGPRRTTANDANRRAQPQMPSALRAFIGKVRTARAKSSDRAPVPDTCLRPKGGRFLTASYTGHTGTRSYKLYIPSAYRGEPLPLIVMLHGCTQSADDFAAGTRMNLVGEEHACFVAYPVQPKSANGSKCWNWFSPRHQHRGRGEPSLIAGITRQIMRGYAIDRRRVYVAGLSAGGAAAVILAETYPDIYAAAGVHSGLARGAARNVPTAFSAMRHGSATISNTRPLSPGPAGNRPPVPVIVFHGDSDKTVHPRNGEQIIEQLRLRDSTDFRAEMQRGQVEGGRSYSRTSYLDGSGRAVLELWVVHEAGHAWSGGSLAGSYTDPQGPDASREMVRFFFEHPQKDAV